MLHGTFHESAWPRGGHSRKRQDLDIIKVNILQSNDEKNHAVLKECERRT
jgi:hypothetical protein